uniref:Cytochrome P450 n=1 Tax=Kalanchoe fedtschenkoi TaxID=63787 RepID=A0A7N0VA42_KALFE
MATVEVVTAVISLLALSLLGFLFRGKITHPLTKWPLLGHLGPFLINTRLEVHDYVTYLLSHSGYTAHLKGPPFTRMNCVVTSDPQNIHYILSSNMSNFNKGPDFKKIFELWGDGILAADADSWRFQRRLNRSLFNHSGFLGLVERTARQKMEGGMFPILDQAAKLGDAVDLRDLFQRFTIDITCQLWSRFAPSLGYCEI